MSYHEVIAGLVAVGEEVTTHEVKERLAAAGYGTTKTTSYLNSEVVYGFFEKLDESVRDHGQIWRRIA